MLTFQRFFWASQFLNAIKIEKMTLVSSMDGKLETSFNFWSTVWHILDLTNHGFFRMENICQKYIYNTYNLQVQIQCLNIYSKSFKYFHSCEENQSHKEIEPVKKCNLKKISFAKDNALFSKCEYAQKN